MGNQLRKLSMRFLKSQRTYFLALILLVSLPGYAQTSLTFGVTFGTKQDDGGPCIGTGVCKESFDLDSATLIYTSNPEAVTVTFQLSPADSNVLMMSFLLSELTQKQPGQVAYFTNAAGTYQFSATYMLVNSAISQLNIPAGAVISPGSSSTVVITGDIVTDYITLSTN
jgi:hypothetical protein